MAVDEQDQIETVVRRIRGVADIPEHEVEERVRDGFRAWADASVRDFVPIFVERRLLDELGAGAEELSPDGQEPRLLG